MGYITEKDIIIHEVIEEHDGGSVLSIELSDNFKGWFKREQNLKRFSQKRFEKWLNKTLKEQLDLMKEEKKQ